MADDLLKYLSGKLQEELKLIEGDLALGTAKDHGEYKFACGRYRGLLMANNIIIETAQRMERDDD
jgi:hypothetical protein